MVQHCEEKIVTLTSKSLLGAYTKLLRHANLEILKRLEEEVTRGEITVCSVEFMNHDHR